VAETVVLQMQSCPSIGVLHNIFFPCSRGARRGGWRKTAAQRPLKSQLAGLQIPVIDDAMRVPTRESSSID